VQKEEIKHSVSTPIQPSAVALILSSLSTEFEASPVNFSDIFTASDASASPCLLGHDEPWFSEDDGDGNSEWAGLRRVLHAAVAARDRGVMTLAMGMFRSAGGGVSRDRAVIPLEQALTGPFCLNEDTSMS